MRFDTEKDVPYKFTTYVVGHDGLTNKSDLIELLQPYDLFATSGEWFFNTWESSRNMCKSFYINDVAKEHRLQTQITICLNETESHEIINYNGTGKSKYISQYIPSNHIIIRIEAGCHSCFDNSNKFYVYKHFKSAFLDEIKEFVINENNRILANIKPDADHMVANKQMTEARYNSLIANN